MDRNFIHIIIKSLVIALTVLNFFVKESIDSQIILNGIILLLLFENNIVDILGKKTEEYYENELIDNLKKIEKAKEDFKDKINL